MRERLADIAHQILEKLPPKVSGASVTVALTDSTPVNFEHDKLKSIKSSKTLSLSLKVIVDGKLGRASVTSPQDIDALIENAVSSAAFGREVKFDFPSPSELPQVKLFDEEVERIETAGMVDMCREMIEILKGYRSEIVTYASASKSVTYLHMANTNGLDYGDAFSSFSVWLLGELVKDEDIVYAGHGFGWRRAEIDHRGIAERVVDKFRKAERTAKISPGRYPVIFPPTGLDILLLTLRLALNGKNVLMGESPLSDKLGKAAFSPAFTLIDSALIDYMSGSGKLDSDGVPKGERKLIDEGVVKGFLYDLDTASRAGVPPTGNDGCSPNNWIIEPGEGSLEEMVASVREGLIAEDFIGLGQGNPISGEFSVNVALGYKIENGEIVGRVKNTMLAGNVYEALKGEIILSGEREWVGGWLYAPAVMIPELNVTSK